MDGSVDGQIAPGTCGHEKFATSPNGETHVDNQLYRAIGCHVGWRNFSIIDSYANEGRKSSGNGIVLIEITGVDDPKNDADVEVSFYKAVPAQFPRDPAGNILPFGRYHIETARGVPRYSATARGRIEKGVLTIAPRDVTLPYFGSLGAFGEMTFRKMNLRLEIASDGKTARGLVGGYRDVESWFNEVKDNEVESGHADFDCPALYEAVHKLADGYPDPKTNQCTAISSAYLIEAVAAFVIHPRETARE